MPFWKCYYHIVWSTKYRQPVIERRYEPVILERVEQKSLELDCVLLALNGIEDHIHAVVSIPPALAIAEWVGQAKGISAHSINTLFGCDPRFQWQAGYSVMSFGERALKRITGYVAGQKRHHALGSLNRWLEYTGEAEP